MTNAKIKKAKMIEALTNQYDAILKEDAIKWLGEMFPEASLAFRITVYNAAYEF
jgi:hypothetical protein